MLSQPVPGSSSTGQVSSAHSSRTGHVDQAYEGACAHPPESDDIPFTDELYSETEVSGTLSDSEEDLLSDTIDETEQMENMNYREAIHSVRSFMDWHHIPTFESDFTELDKSTHRRGKP